MHLKASIIRGKEVISQNYRKRESKMNDFPEEVKEACRLIVKARSLEAEEKVVLFDIVADYAQYKYPELRGKF